jgi:hypothetical protein
MYWSYYYLHEEIMDLNSVSLTKIERSLPDLDAVYTLAFM